MRLDMIDGKEISLADLAAEAMKIADDAADLAAARARAAGRAISCRKGCGACCRQLVPLSPGEAMMIARVVDRLPEAERTETQARFDRAEARLGEAGLFDRLMSLDDPALSDADHYEIAREYFSLALPCPFLEDEACSIHDRRPAACREYAVLSPAERCNDPFNHEIERLESSIDVKEALAGLAAQLFGGEIVFIPLALALAWTRANPEKANAKWPAQELAAKLSLHIDMRSSHDFTLR